jgi:hypothetical protein
MLISINYHFLSRSKISNFVHAKNISLMKPFTRLYLGGRQWIRRRRKSTTELIQFFKFPYCLPPASPPPPPRNKKKCSANFNDDELMYSLKKINVVCHVSRSFISHSLGIIFPSRCFQSHLRACHSKSLVLCEFRTLSNNKLSLNSSSSRTSAAAAT